MKPLPTKSFAPLIAVLFLLAGAAVTTALCTSAASGAPAPRGNALVVVIDDAGNAVAPTAAQLRALSNFSRAATSGALTSSRLVDPARPELGTVTVNPYQFNLRAGVNASGALDVLCDP